MKYRKLSSWKLSLLSAALVTLGFSACKSGKDVLQKRNSLVERLLGLENQVTDRNAVLQKLQDDYENIGRSECVYGGPNNMEEARARMLERQRRQKKSVQEQIQVVEGELDSLRNEISKTNDELNRLGK